MLVFHFIISLLEHLLYYKSLREIIKLFGKETTMTVHNSTVYVVWVCAKW